MLGPCSEPKAINYLVGDTPRIERSRQGGYVMATHRLRGCPETGRQLTPWDEDRGEQRTPTNELTF